MWTVVTGSAEQAWRDPEGVWVPPRKLWTPVDDGRTEHHLRVIVPNHTDVDPQGVNSRCTCCTGVIRGPVTVEPESAVEVVHALVPLPQEETLGRHGDGSGDGDDGGNARKVHVTSSIRRRCRRNIESVSQM